MVASFAFGSIVSFLTTSLLLPRQRKLQAEAGPWLITHISQALFKLSMSDERICSFKVGIVYSLTRMNVETSFDREGRRSTFGMSNATMSECRNRLRPCFMARCSFDFVNERDPA